jgi:hypothetical protein
MNGAMESTVHYRDSMATHEVRNDIHEKMSKAEYMAWKMRMINFKLHY